MTRCDTIVLTFISMMMMAMYQLIFNNMMMVMVDDTSCVNQKPKNEVTDCHTHIVSV